MVYIKMEFVNRKDIKDKDNAIISSEVCINHITW